MSQPTHTLSSILPFVRRAMKVSGNLEYRHYITNLWTEMEKAKVPGVVRIPLGQYHGGEMKYDEPLELRILAAEAFFYLFRNGYIAPSPYDSLTPLDPPRLSQYIVTARGLEWFNGEEPYPEEVDRYMKFLGKLVQNIDPVIEQYVIEALKAFEREANFAAAVMLGAASEKAIYLLADSMSVAISDVNKSKKLKELVDENRSLVKLLKFVEDAIEAASKAKKLPYPLFEGSVHLMSLFEAVRVQRNDAVHPKNASVDPDAVRLMFHSFPYAFSKSEELRAWFIAHPNSI